jgi:hypothetical protein
LKKEDIEVSYKLKRGKIEKIKKYSSSFIITETLIGFLETP